MALTPPKNPTKLHFFTQLTTLEDGKMVVKRFPIGKKEKL